MSRRQSLKTISITILKFTFAIGLVAYLVQSGNLDFRQLSLVLEQPSILLVMLLHWTTVIFLMCGIRWFILLRGQELSVPFGRTIQLHSIGIFFNSVMPGAVSGDLIKAMYVVRDQQSKKTPAMLTIVLDRIVGLMGLFLIGTLSVLTNFQELWNNALLRPIVLMVMGALAVTILIYVLALMPLKESQDPVLRLLSLKLPGFGLLEKVYRGLRSYQKHPWALIGALLISVLTQGINMAYFAYITTVFTGQNVSFFQLGLVYPIGALVTALPLAPGGLGAGHVAFGKLFSLVGIQDGANIFNVFFVGTWLLSMTGAIPYSLLQKKGHAQPTGASAHAKG